jgi:hypothetical protein
MTAETLDKVITKISPFSGKPEDWEGWRCKFEAVLYGKDMLGEGGDDDGDAPESDVAKAFVAKGGAGKRGVVCHGCGDPGHVKAT